MYLFAADEKIVHGCHVSKEAMDKGADGPKWSSKVAEAVGGKAGGKGATSLGQGTNPDKVDEAMEIARKYLEELNI